MDGNPDAQRIVQFTKAAQRCAGDISSNYMGGCMIDYSGLQHLTGDLYFLSSDFHSAEEFYRNHLFEDTHCRLMYGLLFYARNIYVDAILHFAIGMLENQKVFKFYSEASHLHQTGEDVTLQLWSKYHPNDFIKRIYHSKTFQERYKLIDDSRKKMKKITGNSPEEIKAKRKYEKAVLRGIYNIRQQFALKIYKEMAEI